MFKDKLRKIKEKILTLKFQNSEFGSYEWLVKTEIKYGGIVTNVPRHRISPNDSRTEQELNKQGMTGGDRMSTLHHGYGPVYAEFLQPFLNLEKITLVEVGILKGTGLAIWSELFGDGRIVGLDIDLQNVQENMANLKNKGAFLNGNLELYEYDQLQDGKELFSKTLKGDTIDIFIDDGLHSLESIMLTFTSVQPFLSEKYVYFIEDSIDAHKILRDSFPDLAIENFGEISVVCS